ncbi:MAG: hypothetical protein QXX99_07860 [Candidatus Bathyarchaeia archaeon]
MTRRKEEFAKEGPLPAGDEEFIAMKIAEKIMYSKIIENRLPSRAILMISFFNKKMVGDLELRPRESGMLNLEKNLMLLSILNVCVLAEISKGDINGI